MKGFKYYIFMIQHALQFKFSNSANGVLSMLKSSFNFFIAMSYSSSFYPSVHSRSLQATTTPNVPYPAKNRCNQYYFQKEEII